MANDRKYTLLLFDVNETLLDMSPVKKAINQHFGEDFAFKQWFMYLLQFSNIEMVTGHYHDFSVIGKAALDMLGQSLKKEISGEKKEEITSQMAQVQPHADVTAGLQQLKEAGYRLATLTNSAQKIADKQLKHAGIEHFFEASMSVDSMKLFKPNPTTYHQALEQLDVKAEKVLFVAAHGWDITGATRAGLAAAFIAREGQALYPLAPAPAYAAKTLTELASQLP